MNNCILLESSQERRYKCPFCDERYVKTKLVDHIDNKHQNMIPEGYTSARVVFNMINKKEHGTCVCGCGRETPWREDVWRYDRYATPACKEKYSKEMKQRMVRVYGKEHLLNDPEVQEKMLNSRSISGTYKFTHGGEVSYVGSYEMKLLEFLDKVMGYKAIDVESPGPTIEYMYKGKKHFWITDQYLVPYNLVFDCKDGGDNPNNRDMKEYREKQIAKENAIKSQGKYNYIRLTDNNFAQLMLILVELKEQMMNTDNRDPIIRIFESVNESSTDEVDYSKFSKEKLENLYNKKIREYNYAKNYEYSNSALDRSYEIGEMKEELDKIKKALDKMNDKKDPIEELCSAVMGAMVGPQPSDCYIVQYMRKNSFLPEYGITDDLKLDRTIVSDELGSIFAKGKDFFRNECSAYTIFKCNKPVFEKKIDWEPSNIVEAAIGKRILHPEQMLYDPDFEHILSDKDLDAIISESFEATMKSTSNDYKIPIINMNYIDNEFVNFYQDKDGYYVENVLSHLRSKSYSCLEYINDNIVDYISKGKLLG